jgi:hypothetical protein
MKQAERMKAKHSDEIVIIDAPILDLSSQVYRSGVIYSINLDNGMVITSPEGFEAISIAEVKGRPRTAQLPPRLTPALLPG